MKGSNFPPASMCSAYSIQAGGPCRQHGESPAGLQKWDLRPGWDGM